MDEKIKQKLEKMVLENMTNKNHGGKLPEGIRIISFDGPKKYREFFNSLEKAKPFIDSAIEDLKDLQNYLSDVEFLTENEFKIERDVIFQLPTKEEDLDIPKLDSFYYDSRIIVKPVKLFGYEWHIKAEIFFDGFYHTSNPRISELTTMKTRRINTLEESEEENEDGLVGWLPIIQRYPIVFNTGFMTHGVYKHFNLAYHVLSNQLEPFTTQNFMKECMNYLDSHEDSSDEEFYKEVGEIKKQKLKEEDLLCETIVKSWLYEKGFSGDVLFNHGADDIVMEDRYKAFKQIRESGPANVISYYSNYEDWNLEKFLDGSWRSDV